MVGTLQEQPHTDRHRQVPGLAYDEALPVRLQASGLLPSVEEEICRLDGLALWLPQRLWREGSHMPREG